MKKVKLYLAILATTLFVGAQNASAVTEITSGDSYYIQNVGSGLYLCGANHWGTQASVSVQGEMFTPTSVTDGAYTLTDMSLSSSDNKLGDNLFTDNAGCNWNIEAVGDGSFTIKNENGYLAQSATAGYHIGYVLEQVENVTKAAKWYFLTRDEAIAKLGAATKIDPVDASFLISDANFSRFHSTNAWTMNASNQKLCGGILGGEKSNGCAESWRSAFDLNQTIENIPNGTYELTAQAALTDYAEQYDGDNYAVLYANTEYGFFNDMDEADRGTDMSTLSNSFSTMETKGDGSQEPKYQVTISVPVTNGKLTIGVKGTRTDTWCIWDNFQLKYYAPDLTKLQTSLTSTITKAKTVKGKMNGDVASDLANAITAAENCAITESALTSAITNLDNAIDAANNSIAVYSSINDLIASNAASVEKFDAAGQVAYDATAVQTAYDNGTITDGTTETKALQTALQTAVRAQGVGADYTVALSNPDFKTNDLSGWNSNGGATPTVDVTSHNCEFYQSTFNLSQTITNLKKGTYEISFQAFQRTGNANTALADAYESGEWASTAQLYTSAESSEVKNICSEWQDNVVFGEDDGRWPNDSKVTTTDGYLHYIPNSMAGGRVWFDNGYYKTTAKAVVTEDGGSLTFGFKGTSSAGCWILFDNFTMKYVSMDALVDASESEKLIATANELEGKDMKATLLSELKKANKALTANKTNGDLYKTLSEKLSAAQDCAKAYDNAAYCLPEMQKLVESTNIYSADALKSYYTDPKTKYDAKTLTTEEANALQCPSEETVWQHKSTTAVNNFLIPSWTIGDTPCSAYSTPLYINTWSTEGDNDDSNFKVPFYEYWTNDRLSLEEKSMQTSIEGLEAGSYKVTATVRVRLTNDAVGNPDGITFQCNDNQAVNVCDGDIIGEGPLYIKEVAADGTVGEDGVLTIKFNVASGNNISWLAFKNVVYSKASTHSTGIETVSATNADAPLYNLAGQRVNKAQKGIYISNGVKKLMY